MERAGVAVITSCPDDDTDWICDLCNHQIPVMDDITLIPMLAGYALCTDCASETKYWPAGWTTPAPRACPCGACLDT